MKKVVVKSVALMMCVSCSVYAGTVNDAKNILIDNCGVTLQPGRNIAGFGIPYMYAVDFTSAELPRNAQEDTYIAEADFPENAVDGDLSTAAVMGNGENWAFVLDLQCETVINRIAVTFADGAFPVNYDILVTTEEKPSAASDGSAAMANWAENLDLIINESQNLRAGVHEFNFKPIKARYVVVRDNIAQTNVRQMGIAEIEVNEAADFYLHGNEEFTALYGIEKGTVKRVLNEDKDGVMINALYDGGAMTGDMTVKKVGGQGDGADIYIDKKTEYEDYTRSALKDIYFVSSPTSKKKRTPEYTYLSDSPGKRYLSEIGYTGRRIYLYKAELAVDESGATYASGSTSGGTLCMEFEEEKEISAAEIVFEQNGCPQEFDIVAETADGTRQTVVSVSDNNKNDLNFEFEKTAAKKVYIKGKGMHIADVHIYDKAPQYYLQSFVFSDIYNITPADEKKILK